MNLHTERLTLRPFSPQDADAFIVGIEDRELRRMYGFPLELSKDTAHRIFAHFSELPMALSLVRNEDNAMIGFLLDVPAELPEPMLRTLPEGGRTLAFATFVPYQRQGYMREAIQAVMEQHSSAGDASYLHGGHFLLNRPCQCLLAGLGFSIYGGHTVGTHDVTDEIRMLKKKQRRRK